MTTWTSDELTRIARAEELEMAPLRRNGTLRVLVPTWVVRDGAHVYVRSFRGTDGAWWRTARASRRRFRHRRSPHSRPRPPLPAQEKAPCSVSNSSCSSGWPCSWVRSSRSD
ncbi:DUF2255 family protein [Streptomyces sp. NPDC053253]|uniref:DUF2255 family protein n=1 Tax=Streptomyces sp. NPDC053253 TaxID=3365699 RepID=UPI0037CD7082